jgi:hypothetical protein
MVVFLLRFDIGHLQGSVNFVNLNNSNTGVILSLGIQTFFSCTYKLLVSQIIRMCTIKTLGVHLNWELHFHAFGDYIFPQCVRMLGWIRTITSTFSTFVDLLIFCVTLVRSKLEYKSAVWNSIQACPHIHWFSIQGICGLPWSEKNLKIKEIAVLEFQNAHQVRTSHNAM